MTADDKNGWSGPAAAVSAAPEAFAALLDGFTVPAVLLAPDYRILAANQAYRSLYGRGGEVLGRACHAVSHGADRPCDEAGESCPIRAARWAAEPRRVLHVHHTPLGDQHVDVEVRPIYDGAGALQYFVELLRPTRGASVSPHAAGMVGRSSAFNAMLALIQRVAPSETAALLLGESGTGKELVARAIHDGSARRDGALVPVECSGLTESLFESELFGHEKGAFTGALARREGLVSAARGGTLFLDEIGDIPLNLQVKLLRLLETGSYRRVGGNEPQQADFRLVCATHRDLPAMVAAGAFRADLYYRIAVFPIELPPLRERLEDLPLLAGTLLKRIPGGGGKHLSAAALGRLAAYAFPGNVRELRNLLERACLLADGDLIGPEHLPALGAGRSPRPGTCVPDEIVPLAELERRYLAQAAVTWTGDRGDLARRLGISERTLFRKLRELKSHARADAATG